MLSSSPQCSDRHEACGESRKLTAGTYRCLLRLKEHARRRDASGEWRFVEIAGLAAEASHFAAQAQSRLVSAEHVERAIEPKIRRSNLIEERLVDMVTEGTLRLDLEGQRLGQVNGSSVVDLGDYAFGRPVRITATAGPGRPIPLTATLTFEQS